MTTPRKKRIVIIGGGPAGLMAAETAARAGREVHLYEAMPSVGRKFLRAGVGGLNITHAEPFEQFLARYGTASPHLAPMLRDFGPGALRAWLEELGFESFIGTSGRVFPTVIKASPILRAWLRRLEAQGVTFHTEHRWVGLAREDGLFHLSFETQSGLVTTQARQVLLALGGASWPRLGSRGDWAGILQGQGLALAPFRPANCGFDVAWSAHFREKFDGAPLKAVRLKFEGFDQQGEFIITKDGLEGSLIYAASAGIRDALESGAPVEVHLDLAPDWPGSRLIERLSRPRGSRSVSSHLEKAIGLKGVKAGLLREFLPRETFDDPALLASAIKTLPVPLLRPRPLAEAISSAGGVPFSELDENLMVKKLPGLYCAGEMLDWEAPTGGYLLTACFATGKWVGETVRDDDAGV